MRIIQTNYFKIRLKNLKQEYLAKDPLGKWRFISEITMSLAKHIGCNFADEDYKLTLRTLLPAIVVIYYVVLLIYSMYSFRNDPLRVLMSTPAVGIIFSVCYIICILLTRTCDIHSEHLYSRPL